MARDQWFPFMKELTAERDYLQILSDKVHPMAQALFPKGNAIFQDDNASTVQLELLKNDMRNNVIKLSILYGQHNLQTQILLSTYGQF